MKSKNIGKMRSQVGESIAETLVALLISALALMMLAGAVSSGMRIVTNSRIRIDEYYQVSNAMVARQDNSPIDSQSITGELTVSITNLLPSSDPPARAKYWKNEQISGVPVIAYTKSDT